MAESSKYSVFKPPISSERAPTAEERKKWEQSKERLRIINRNLYASYLYLKNASLAQKSASQTGNLLSFSPDEETDRFLNLYRQYDDIKNAMRLVEDYQAGIKPSGNDWDIIVPPTQMGFPVIAAAVIGTVLVAGLIARLIYLETETQDLSDHLNGVMEAADKALCTDPNSENCLFWEQQKKQEGWHKNVTLADEAKSAVKTIGKGLSVGLLIAVPLIGMALLNQFRSGK